VRGALWLQITELPCPLRAVPREAPTVSRGQIVSAVNAFLDECRADPRYAAHLTAIAGALHALYLESDGTADAIAFMDAVTWVLKQPRTLDERFEVLSRLFSCYGKVIENIREFARWTS
jgi:hypothetical protein